jgi:Flp pilus assembly protein TadD
MKSHVNSSLTTSIILSFLLGGYVVTSGQTNQCDCALPPGGSVTCEIGQVPICIVRDGKVISMCKSPPESKETVAQQNAWLLSIILDKEVTVEDLKRKPEYQSLLREGRLETSLARAMFLPVNPPPKYLQLEATDERSMRARLKPPTRLPARPPKDSDYETHYELGMDLINKQLYMDAETEFRKALQIVPGQADAYRGLGLTLYKRRRFSEAEAAFRKGLQLKPDYADLYADLGATLYAEDKYSKAEDALKNGLRLYPDKAEFYAKLGIILYAQLKFAEAEEAFRYALRLEPANAVFHANMGDALYAQQKYAEARNIYQAAALLAPLNSTYKNKLQKVINELK